jgi:putative transposase
MPRLARIVVPDCPHHVTQRGNNRQDIFFVRDDYTTYLQILREQAGRFGLTIDGYCLMTNHVHLIVTPASQSALAQAIGRTHWCYSQYVNRLHRRSGHLWQSRFYSCPLDDDHFWTAMAYVERNPVRAGILRKACRYEHSSAVAHVTGQDERGLVDLRSWRERRPPAWAEVLDEPQDPQTVTVVRCHLFRGRPLGSDSWLSKIEAKMGRRLRPLPVGRPRKRKGRTPSSRGK